MAINKWNCGLTAILGIAVLAPFVVGQSEGPGHALLFRNHAVLKTDFKDFPTDAMTFEGWFSTSDTCHNATLMSYAIDSKSTNRTQRVIDFNHFVIFNPYSLIACHDYYYLELRPDERMLSCRSSFSKVSGHEDTVSLISREDEWHHLAVTWEGSSGETLIYVDGLLMARGYQTGLGQRPSLVANGAMVLGGEQDCFGGCLDSHQGFYGYMDELRLWKRVRTQQEIIEAMKITVGLENTPDLVAWWQFNDVEEGRSRWVARDSSGRGNHLQLVKQPTISPRTSIVGPKGRVTAGALSFKNNFAMNSHVKAMPDKDFTIELWARTPPYSVDTDTEEFYELLSYATIQPGNDQVNDDTVTIGGVTLGAADTAFLDDGIRIRKYNTQFASGRLAGSQLGTIGTISVHVNGNHEGNGQQHDYWIDFLTGWVDDSWHHIALTWRQQDGEINLYFDGEPQKPFWSSQAGVYKEDTVHGVPNRIAGGTLRSSVGALVLGQDQECYSGCFSPKHAYDGDLAVLRIWDHVRTKEEIMNDMDRVQPSRRNGLRYMWDFEEVAGKAAGTEGNVVVDSVVGEVLQLGSDAPMWVPSGAPVYDGFSGSPNPPRPHGHALHVSDQQVAMMPKFDMFPQTALTAEIWMLSVDACHSGAIMSYARSDGKYREGDNSFLIFNYNSIGISIMEDEGGFADHNSGFAPTDGRWHHIAVTWDMKSGRTRLYDNGRLVWTVRRSNGTAIVPGGVLILGREQDCAGGCFDSARGAIGALDPVSDLEYGAQDFFGLIDDTRIWNRELSQQELLDNIRRDTGTYSANAGEYGSFYKPGVDPKTDGLVSYWSFVEGRGSKTADLTGNGNTLFLLKGFHWETVEWLALCGDGEVSPGEECDDGNTSSGDGCSSDCRIEDGWLCPSVAPGLQSICFTKDGSMRQFVPSSSSSDLSSSSSGVSSSSAGSGSGSSKSKSKSSGAGAAIAIILVLAVIVLLAWVAYYKREAIYEAFPKVKYTVAGIQQRLGMKPASTTADYGMLVEEPVFGVLQTQNSFTTDGDLTSYQAVSSPQPTAPAQP